MPPKKRRPKVPKKKVKVVDVKEKIASELVPLAKKEWVESQQRVFQGKVPAHLGSADFMVHINEEIIERMPLKKAEKAKAKAQLATDAKLTLYMYHRLEGRVLETDKLLDSIKRAKKQLAGMPANRKPNLYTSYLEAEEKKLREHKSSVIIGDEELLNTLHDTNMRSLISTLGETRFRLLQAVLKEIQKSLGVNF